MTLAQDPKKEGVGMKPKWAQEERGRFLQQNKGVLANKVQCSCAVQLLYR